MEPPRSDRWNQSDGHAIVAERPARDGGMPPLPSARSALAPEPSAILRERLVAKLEDVNSADEAAVWAHRNLPAKNTLTAADAKIVEEQFRRGSPPPAMATPLAGPLTVRPLAGRLTVWRLTGSLMLSPTKAWYLPPSRARAQNLRQSPRNGLAAAQSVPWAKWRSFRRPNRSGSPIMGGYCGYRGAFNDGSCTRERDFASSCLNAWELLREMRGSYYARRGVVALEDVPSGSMGEGGGL